MQLPETTINPNRKIIVTRLLPVPGQVLVKRGQAVDALEVIARGQRAGRYRVIDLGRQLAQPHVEMAQVMLKKKGEAVEANEPIAAIKGGLPWLRRTVRAPAAGRVAALGPGWVLLESEPTLIELRAFINGVVTRVIPERGAVIESGGAMIKAACGFGGEAYGSLRRLVNQPFESIQPAAIDENLKEAIILGGRTVDEATLRLAEEVQVRGIIVGSLDATLMKLEPPVNVAVVATEGFGDVPMSPYTFGILATTLGGKEVSIRGNTPLLSSAAGQRAPAEPPIILATTRRGSQADFAASTTEPGKNVVQVGSRVRVIRGKWLGASGLIDSLPAEPQPTEAGIVTSGAYVKFDNAVHYIPWANLERVS